MKTTTQPAPNSYKYYFMYHYLATGIDITIPLQRTPWYKVFGKDSSGQIYAFQRNDSQFRERLAYYKNEIISKGPHAVKFVRWLEKLPHDKWFFMLDRQLDTAETVEIEEILRRKNGLPPQENLESLRQVSKIYNTRTFAFHRTVRKQAPVRCRFCGRKKPEVSFRRTAHALSVFTGNEILFCFDECDDCNSHFGNGIEMDMRHILLPNIFMDGDKNVKKEIRGPNFRKSYFRGPTLPNEQMNRRRVLETFWNDLNEPYLLDMSYYPFIPQNVYKCLVKYAFSLMDPNEVESLRETVEWVRGSHFVEQLPAVRRESAEGHSGLPGVCLSRNKGADESLPFYFCRLTCLKVCYTYQIPVIKDGLTDMGKDVTFRNFIDTHVPVEDSEWLEKISVTRPVVQNLTLNPSDVPVTDNNRIRHVNFHLKYND